MCVVVAQQTLGGRIIIRMGCLLYCARERGDGREGKEGGREKIFIQA